MRGIQLQARAFTVTESLTSILVQTGTSSIVDENTHEPILSILTLIVETAAKLHRDGHNVVLVSSGAVGVGLRRMDIEERPKHLPRIQVIRHTMLRIARYPGAEL